MILYHCSKEAYSPQEIIGPYAQSLFSAKQKKDGFDWAEQILEKAREPLQPCRRTNAVYACDSVVNAYIFASGENFMAESQSPIYCYEVEAAEFSKAPMALVGVLNRARDDIEVLQQIAAEYWNPIHSWRYWEYFSPSMKVIRAVPQPEIWDVVSAKFAYDADLRDATHRWNLSKPPKLSGQNKSEFI